MAEAAGLAIGAITFSSLFSTCVQCFDLVIGAKNFSKKYDFLDTQLKSVHLRFLIWGRAAGLATVPNAPVQGRNLTLDQPYVRPVVEAQLLCIKLLLDAAAKVRRRYVMGEEDSAVVGAFKRLEVTSHLYATFKHRIRKNQRQISWWSASRWTLHDHGKLNETVQDLRTAVDELEKLTGSLARLYQSKLQIFPVNVRNQNLLAESASQEPESVQINAQGEWEFAPDAACPERMATRLSLATEGTRLEIHGSELYELDAVPQQRDIPLPARLCCDVKGCQATFISNPKFNEMNLRRHRKMTHSRTRQLYNCPYCRKSFNRPDNCRDHVRLFHTNLA